MYTLHRLKESKRRRTTDPSGDASTYDDTRTGQPPPPDDEKAPFDPTSIIGDTYPWGFGEDELEKFPALKKRNFWCIQRHQARGESPIPRCWTPSRVDGRNDSAAL